LHDKDERQLGGNPSGNSYSLIGFNECRNCAATSWLWLSDSRTGSSYKECRECGCVVLLNRGYIDKDLGIGLSKQSDLGSYDTYQPADGYVSHEISGVSL